MTEKKHMKRSQIHSKLDKLFKKVLNKF